MTKLSMMLAVLAIACSGGGTRDPGNGNPDAPGTGVDASTVPVPIPTWMLVDIQPLSPRANQTYGLDVFAGRTIVVTLSQGF